LYLTPPSNNDSSDTVAVTGVLELVWVYNLLVYPAKLGDMSICVDIIM